MSRRVLLAGLTAVLTLFLLSPVSGPSRSLDAALTVHLKLDRSAPEADAAVASPSEIRLWFSQVPQSDATSARLVREGAPVEAMGDLKPDTGDASIFAAPVEGTLAPGVYTVAWRTMAADGHVVRGDFDFTVQAR